MPAAIRHVASRPRPTGPRPQVKAIAFDGFALFDPRPVSALAETHFPGRGGSVMETWRSRQFEYHLGADESQAVFRRFQEIGVVAAERAQPLDNRFRHLKLHLGLGLPR